MSNVDELEELPPLFERCECPICGKPSKRYKKGRILVTSRGNGKGITTFSYITGTCLDCIFDNFCKNV